MAFEVETGTGSSTATAYVTTAEADAYWSDRGDTVWAALTAAQKQAAIIRATAFIDALSDWRGTKGSGTQALDWPRIGVIDDDGYLLSQTSIPAKLKACVCEFAYLARSSALVETFTKTVLEERVDGAVAVKYDPGSPDGTRYDHLWAMIRDYTSGSSVMGETVRG